MKTVLFIGRWQPLHRGHKTLIQQAKNMGHRVVVGVRDTKRDKDNPFSYRKRKRMIKKAFNNVSVIKIPDKDCNLDVWVGRKVGYRVIKLPESVEQISGTRIRELMTVAE